MKLDASCFRGYNVHNGLEITRVFGLQVPQATFAELARVTRPVYHYKLSAALRKFIPPRKTECFENADYSLNEDVFTPGDRYYWGYWQNWRYFIDCAEDIKELFRFKLALNERSIRLLNHLTQTTENTISIHVRRGDYLKVPNYAGLCGIEYYRGAIRYVLARVESPHFFVFSDDMTWCRKHIRELTGEENTTYVDWNRGEESVLDMLLMSHCRHMIIANSSFSWWGAFLNNHRDKIICAPEKWTNTKVNCTFQLPEWVLI